MPFVTGMIKSASVIPPRQANQVAMPAPKANFTGHLYSPVPKSVPCNNEFNPYMEAKMTELDRLLDRCIKEEEEQRTYYDLVLNSNFYIPILEEGSESGVDDDNVTPVILEADGKPYMMLFDTEQRLLNWANQEIRHIVLPGHSLVEISTEELHWALNIGTDYQKEFNPEEIGWLKNVVKQCQVKAALEGEMKP